MKTAHKTVFQKINAPFETAPVVEYGPNVFSMEDYGRSVNISLSQANRRVNELLRRKTVRRVMVKTPAGLRERYEYLGED